VKILKNGGMIKQAITEAQWWRDGLPNIVSSANRALMMYIIWYSLSAQ
jgi:hypothetical protein